MFPGDIYYTGTTHIHKTLQTPDTHRIGIEQEIVYYDKEER